TREPESEQTRRALLPVLLRDRPMIAMTLIYVAYFTLFLQTFATLPLFMTADGHGPAAYGAILAFNGILIVLGQPLAVRLLAGRDPSAVLAVSILLVGAGTAASAGAHTTAAYAASVATWTLGQIGIAVMFGSAFAGLAPADLRGAYMGIASATWNLGGVFGPLVGTVLLNHAGRGALATVCAITGIVLFACQRALGPTLQQQL
ncbi:MAG: MFS transporter, partial [Mycobacteriaceae bacterium]|nr:MFS transporter [Mycobacteriaceae bacterium]